MKTNAYAALAVNTPLVPYSFERRELRADDCRQRSSARWASWACWA